MMLAHSAKSVAVSAPKSDRVSAPNQGWAAEPSLIRQLIWGCSDAMQRSMACKAWPVCPCSANSAVAYGAQPKAAS